MVHQGQMQVQCQPWVALVVLPFALLLCPIMVSLTQTIDHNGRPTYQYAGFAYPEHAQFDNTWLTWSTDYVISLVMLIESVYIYKMETVHRRLQKLILVLFCFFGGSTLVGGVAHHTYHGDPEQLNGLLFYLMWVIVVGCTAIAGGIQGEIGDELLSIHGFKRTFAPRTWVVWGFVLLVLIMLGCLSCVRPACDIFLAGVTQSIPVFYLQYCLYLTTFRGCTLSRATFWLLFVGVIFNAPLIVLYPHLLEHLGAPVTNVVLHTTLLVSWGGQGLGYFFALAELPAPTAAINTKKLN